MVVTSKHSGAELLTRFLFDRPHIVDQSFAQMSVVGGSTCREEDGGFLHTMGRGESSLLDENSTAGCGVK